MRARASKQARVSSFGIAIRAIQNESFAFVFCIAWLILFYPQAPFDKFVYVFSRRRIQVLAQNTELAHFEEFVSTQQIYWTKLSNNSSCWYFVLPTMAFFGIGL